MNHHPLSSILIVRKDSVSKCLSLGNLIRRGKKREKKIRKKPQNEKRCVPCGPKRCNLFGSTAALEHFFPKKSETIHTSCDSPENKKVTFLFDKPKKEKKKPAKFLHSSAISFIMDLIFIHPHSSPTFSNLSAYLHTS